MKLIFVSSTFKDMQFERDMLQTYVIPTLNEQLREYGEKVYFGDLRWGVNTTDLDSDEGSRKVLKVCLDQIDNCKPYMIVLIGERYGWIPAQELLDEACVLKGINKINDISVTELEIDYGALLNPEYGGRIMFYFRNLDKSGMTDAQRRDYDAESGIHLQKVKELKQRIGEIYPNNIRYYDAVWDAESQKVIGLENFLSQVKSDLINVLLRDLERENNLPWQERSMQAAHRYFEENNKTLVPTNNSNVAYIGSSAEDSAIFIYVTGKEGCGKSATIMTGYCSDENEKLAFSFGLDKFSRNAFDFERILIYKLEEILVYEHQEFEDEQLDEIVLRYLSSLKDPIGIYVDNADEDFLQFLSRLEMEYRAKEESIEINALFMIAVQKELPFYPFFELSVKLLIGDLSAEDSELVLDSIVRSNHKEISDVVKTRILSKENSCSAAYLKNIVKRLMILDSEDFTAIRAMGDGMNNINKYMMSIVDDTADGRYEILVELINEAMDRINRNFVERLMGIFTHIPVGLKIDDIRGIFNAYGWEFNDLNFSLAVQMLEDVLNYNPNTRFYKIKNRAIENSIFNADAVWDAVPAAEYMLNEKELRPYAFRAAIFNLNQDYLCSVLERSEITDITESIRYLVERGLKEKAIVVILAIAENKNFWDIKLLPSFREFKLSEYKLAYEFFCELAAACNERLTKDTLLFLEIDLEARFAVAEYALDIDPKITIDMLIKADELIRKYAQKIDVAVINRMYFLMLKAVNKTKSKELFDKYIVGEEYLNVFRYVDEYYETIFKMKVYTEFSEIVGVLDYELEQVYLEKAIELAISANVSDCVQEDFVYLAKLLNDQNWILLGKVFYPFDLDLLRAEVMPNSSDEQTATVDKMNKAAAIWNYTGFAPDCIRYWRLLLYHLMGMDEPDDDLVDEYILFTEYLIKQGLETTDYVDILPFALMLSNIDDVKRLLDAANTEGELESIVQDMIRYYCIEEDIDKLLDLRENFNKIRNFHMGAERVATLFIEKYFDVLIEDE